ncbi:RCC1 and BTB domain-containing protein 2-like [Strongylocentrotus purpuratus]|uniref:RCC1-like domain-containing protein n=1 Tax=Strongylocentrotus purpuratus TaxID=7668 RepID=A0A7M7NP00_STRPU|nr:RCC1 and BTB domain-containing protein 2-like [Strongylocentrotus purpuratus]
MATSEDSDVAMVIMKGPLARTPIRDACSNSECIAMVTSERRVYVCDLTDASKQHKYVKVNFTTSEGDDKPDVDIVSVCCGRHHFLALSARGRVYSWGKNNYGQLGLRKKKQKHHRRQDKEKEAPKPRVIAGLSIYDVIKIACGDNHSLALTPDGRLFCWGSNGNGQLSIGEQLRTRHHSEVPTQVKGLANVTVQHIAAGGAHTAVVSLSGSVYVWGSNSHGQLGLLVTQVIGTRAIWAYMQNLANLVRVGHNMNGELYVLGMGVGTHPHQWYKTEVSPGRTDKTHLYSSLQSYGRYTFVVEQSNCRPFVLDHGEVGGLDLDGPSQCLQLDPLEGTTFADTFGPEALPEWPHRQDNADVELYKVQKVKVQKDG